MASSSESHGTHDLNFPVESSDYGGFTPITVGTGTPMTNDKELEADKWPEPPEAVWVWGKYRKYVETYCEPTEIKQDEFEVPVTKYIRADLAVSDPLSALPGEAEVVERLRKLTSPDAEMLSDGYRLTEIIKLNPADALQAMQARAEAAEEALRVSELEGDAAFALAVDDPGKNPPVTWKSRAETAEARVKELEEVLAYAEKGLDMIHNGLMDPTRPRQSVGEVCAHFLSTARTGGSNG